MSLLAIRNRLITFSGNRNLSDEDWAYFVNAGQKYLDALVCNDLTREYYEEELEADQSEIVPPRLRVAELVWVATNEEPDSARPLGKASLSWIQSQYKTGAEIENGAPLYYSPATIRSEHSSDPTRFLNKKGIVVYPPSDGTHTLTLQGAFFTDSVSAEDDETFWTETYPSALVSASMLKYEEMMRNTEGTRDWLAAIEREVNNINADIADEESTEAYKMKG